MIKKHILVLLFVSLLSACSDDKGTFQVDWKDGPYQIIWDGQQRTLSKKLRDIWRVVIFANVVAIGSDDCVIVVKQVEKKTGQLYYYIIQKDAVNTCSNSPVEVVSPKDGLSESAFKAIHSLPDFSMTF